MSSGPNKSGNDNYVSPELIKSKETPIKLDAKKVTKIDAPKSKTPEVKRTAQKQRATLRTYKRLPWRFPV